VGGNVEAHIEGRPAALELVPVSDPNAGPAELPLVPLAGEVGERFGVSLALHDGNPPVRDPVALTMSFAKNRWERIKKSKALTYVGP
jgi:hypothetical protein